jgi:hypothetical protein
MAAEALGEHRQRQADARLRAGALWQDNGLVFDSARDPARRGQCAPVAPDHLPESWPGRRIDARELRHTFVSLL